MRAKVSAVDFSREEGFWSRGITWVAGVDEVGRGPLAGPVLAAAVVLPPGVALPGLDDSKRLTARARAELDRMIRAAAWGLGIGAASAGEIDRWNIHRASLEAMRRALADLPRPPGAVLVDALTIPHLPWSQEGIVHGDRLSSSIAAASVVAKVARDRLMERYATLFPGYGFERHRGYGTAAHLAALAALGPCPLHRRSFLHLG
ncbi:MAG: ribonuclease HII [Thermaerobacter sp.]|nr:ribonuclease HII [Thermaerobacter sp.]